jgi:hypothetical protein
MNKLAHKLANLAQELYEKGNVSESKAMLFSAIRIAHQNHPLVEVLGNMGFEQCEDYENELMDELSIPERSQKHTSVQEIWIHIGPKGIEYGLMNDDDNQHFDNLEDLVSHIVDEGSRGRFDFLGDNTYRIDPDEEMYHSCKHGGSCSCGGECKTASKKKKNVKLNKPFRTPDGPKKFSVYVKNDKGNVVKVNFGDPNMRIKKSNPKRRKSFRARHRCETPGPKWKARFWSCKAW